LPFSIALAIGLHTEQLVQLKYKNKTWLQFLFVVKCQFKTANINILSAYSTHRSHLSHLCQWATNSIIFLPL